MVFALTAFSFAGEAVHAQPPAAQASAEACLDAVYSCVVGASQQINGFGAATAGGYASASAADSPGVSVQASSRVFPYPGAGYSAGADVIHAFDVYGPTATNVPIDITFRAAAAAGAQGLAQAFIDAGWTTLVTTPVGSYSPRTYNGFSVTNSADVKSYLCRDNDCATSLSAFDAQVEANTTVRIEVNANTSGGAIAFVDPVVYLYPTWATRNPGLASQVSLAFSSGVQTGVGAIPAGIPEPGAWALMIVGLGLLGGVLRARPSVVRMPSSGRRPDGRTA
jgi:hypothetical protein